MSNAFHARLAFEEAGSRVRNSPLAAPPLFTYVIRMYGYTSGGVYASYRVYCRS